MSIVVALSHPTDDLSLHWPGPAEREILGADDGASTGYLRVRLVRSVISEKPRVRRALQGLGLRGQLNQVRVHRNDATTLGAIRRARHLVEVEYVSRGGISSGVWPGFRGAEYSVGARPARRVDAPDGQFVVAEAYGGYYGVKWSSTLPARQTSWIFEKVVATGRPSIEIRTRDEVLCRDSFMAADDDLRRGGQRYLGVDFELATLYWKPSRLTDSPFFEVGLLTPELGEDFFVRLATMTATPDIADYAAELTHEFDFAWSDVSA